jgi:hypothetical protein
VAQPSTDERQPGNRTRVILSLQWMFEQRRMLQPSAAMQGSTCLLHYHVTRQGATSPRCRFAAGDLCRFRRLGKTPVLLTKGTRYTNIEPDSSHLKLKPIRNIIATIVVFCSW